MRNRLIHFRASNYESQALEALARYENRTVSETLREIIRSEYQRKLKRLQITNAMEARHEDNN